MKEKFKKINSSIKEINNFREKISKLEKKDINLIISDLDDTIFSTEEIIKKDYRKGRRGDKGNEYLIKNNLLDKIIREEYKNKDFPKNISSKLVKNQDLILTAGIKDFQTKKRKTLKLDNINMIVVDSGKDKILETIKYIVKFLKFIPNKITVYEDRPKYFIEYKDLIEEVLGTKLEIMYVEMDGNKGYKKIKKI